MFVVRLHALDSGLPESKTKASTFPFGMLNVCHTGYYLPLQFDEAPSPEHRRKGVATKPTSGHPARSAICA
jgi:hypothetical protein